MRAGNDSGIVVYGNYCAWRAGDQAADSSIVVILLRKMKHTSNANNSHLASNIATTWIWMQLIVRAISSHGTPSPILRSKMTTIDQPARDKLRSRGYIGITDS